MLFDARVHGFENLLLRPFRRIAQHIERLILPQLANVWLSAMQENKKLQRLQLDIAERVTYAVHALDSDPEIQVATSQSTHVVEKH